MDQRDDFLSHFLKHVIFDGWTKKAIQHTLNEMEQTETDLYLLFPGGLHQIAEYWLQKNNENMERQFIRSNNDALKIREKIALLVKLRLENNTQHKEAIRSLLVFYADPFNKWKGLRSLYETVNKMWYLAGDNATDWNFYSKRALLSYVYMTTLVYWLNDHSKDNLETNEFLDRRIAEVMKIPSLLGNIRKFSPPLFLFKKDFLNSISGKPT